MSEPKNIRRKSINDMMAQFSRIAANAGEGSPRYERARAALVKYSDNIKATKRSRRDKEMLEYLGINDLSRDEIRNVNRALFGRRYAKRTYAK